ncbi:hypothetical protein GNI_190290 [Gregarina niphandrodes]|uniref:Uncharacterized protein n=1 Tax=Gregarina niphandrodes TaxID=110365 RepID=A0A023AXP9_GRENI|nr:hypothetical protein GNI_190290 [Gregarina niphandrodes]EZG43075.1 hypothetical protein GNI_190290 [Gregarina niphandrodes]|eukprot:XP_011133653.1 hypothetical protein GNI_190290 [Gregarina niphandrodes]
MQLQSDLQVDPGHDQWPGGDKWEWNWCGCRVALAAPPGPLPMPPRRARERYLEPAVSRTVAPLPAPATTNGGGSVDYSERRRRPLPGVIWFQQYPVNELTHRVLTDVPLWKLAPNAQYFIAEYGNHLPLYLFQNCFPPHASTTRPRAKPDTHDNPDAQLHTHPGSNPGFGRSGGPSRDPKPGRRARPAQGPLTTFGRRCFEAYCVRHGVCFHRFRFITVAGRPWVFAVDRERSPTEEQQDLGVVHAPSGAVTLYRACPCPTGSPPRSQQTSGCDWWSVGTWAAILSFLPVHDVLYSGHWVRDLRRSRLPGLRGAACCVPRVDVCSLAHTLTNDFRSDVMVPLLDIPHSADRVALSFKWHDQHWGNQKAVLYALYLKRKQESHQDQSQGLDTTGRAQQGTMEPNNSLFEVAHALFPNLERTDATNDQSPDAPLDSEMSEDEYYDEPAPTEAGPTGATPADVGGETFELLDTLWDEYDLLGVSVPAHLADMRDAEVRVELPPEEVCRAERIVLCYTVGGGGGHSLSFDYFKVATVRFQALPAVHRSLAARVFAHAALRDKVLTFLHRAAQEPLRCALDPPVGADPTFRDQGAAGHLSIATGGISLNGGYPPNLTDTNPATDTNFSGNSPTPCSEACTGSSTPHSSNPHEPKNLSDQNSSTSITEAPERRRLLLVQPAAWFEMRDARPGALVVNGCYGRHLTPRISSGTWTLSGNRAADRALLANELGTTFVRKLPPFQIDPLANANALLMDLCDNGTLPLRDLFRPET